MLYTNCQCKERDCARLYVPKILISEEGTLLIFEWKAFVEFLGIMICSVKCSNCTLNLPFKYNYYYIEKVSFHFRFS